MTLAVLAHRGDPAADAVAEALACRVGAEAVRLVWAEDLMLSAHWRHTLQRGVVASEVVLRDGRVLRSEELDGVFCRLRYAPTPLFAASPRADRDYAAMEGYALLMSWLAALPCRVVNPAGSRGLSGGELSFLEWLSIGVDNGVRARGVRLESSGSETGPDGWLPHRFATAPPTTLLLERIDQARGRPAVWLEPLGGAPVEVFVVGEQVLGAPPERAAACRAIARTGSCPLLSLQFAPAAESGQAVLCGADPSPRLSDAAVEAVADLVAGIS